MRTVLRSLGARASRVQLLPSVGIARTLCTFSSGSSSANDAERMLLGASAVAERLLSSGDTAKGAEVLTNVVAGMRELRGNKHPDTISCMTTLAQALSKVGGDRADEAEALAREAAASAQAVFGKRHPDASLATVALSHVLVRRGSLEEAEALMRECHEAAREAAASAGKPTSLEQQMASSDLAQVLQAQHKLREAVPFAREALESSIQLLGRAHEHTLDELGTIGPLLEAVGELDEAEAAMRTRLQTCRNVLGDAHPQTLVALHGLARFLAAKEGDDADASLDEAEGLLLEDLDMSRAVHGSRHMETLATVSDLAQLLYKRRRYADALPLAEEAVATGELLLGGAHQHRRELRYLLACIEHELPAGIEHERPADVEHERPAAPREQRGEPPPTTTTLSPARLPAAAMETISSDLELHEGLELSMVLLSSWPQPGAAWARPSAGLAM